MGSLFWFARLWPLARAYAVPSFATGSMGVLAWHFLCARSVGQLTATLLKLEVFAEGTVVDELVGSCTVDAAPLRRKVVPAKWYPLDTGGELQCSLGNRVRQRLRNRSLGAR